MKEVYLLRHGEKDAAGALTRQGKQIAKEMRSILPTFTYVISSDSDRTILTAELLTGESPRVDYRAAYAMASVEISNEINALAKERNISFLDAARQYANLEVLRGIDNQAHNLNTMIDELLDVLAEDEKALIVSHDLTIVPAMGFRGMSAESIEPLSGYVISVDKGVASIRRY